MTRPDAREKMLDAAEDLMAERGVLAVSLREVGQAAGQRNNSAAQYHFGSREGLVSAVIDRRSAPVEARRLVMRQALGTTTATVRQLLEIFVLPLVEVAGRHPRYVRFLDQVLLARMNTPERLDTSRPGVQFVHDGLRRGGPPISPQRFARRCTWMAETTLHVLATTEPDQLADPTTLAEIVEDLLATLEALHTAPA